MKTPVLLLAGCAVLTGLSAAAAQVPGAAGKEGSVRARLLGNWKLVSYVVFDANGGSRPGNYDIGRVVYDAAGEMSAHLMSSKRGTENPTTDAARSLAYSTYLAYFGPFIVDEAKGTVTHRVIGSSYPHWVGTDQVRYYSFDPIGRLTLSVKTGDRITGSLLWERISN
jgi:hypothetical protein